MTIYKVSVWFVYWVDNYTDAGYEDWTEVTAEYFRNKRTALWRLSALKRKYQCEGGEVRCDEIHVA